MGLAIRSETPEGNAACTSTDTGTAGWPGHNAHEKHLQEKGDLLTEQVVQQMTDLVVRQVSPMEYPQCPPKVLFSSIGSSAQSP
ncbi:hypothetical protein FKM82_004098 [Ascaphus truei]